MREMQVLVRKYILNRDRQMKYLAVLIALSLFVSFMVPFILMQPADSMAEAATCGIEEHVHTLEGGCYQMVCVPEEEHVHSDFCYMLTCEKLVHTHTPECYPTKPDFTALFSTIYDPENLKATATGTDYSNPPEDHPSEYKAPAGSLLGVATHFHIFAESVDMQSHVHGNIATNYLLQNGAFGVYNDRLGGMTSINYIRNLGPNASLDNAYQTQLIMGSNYSSPPTPPNSNMYQIRDMETGKVYSIPKDKFGGDYKPQLKFERPNRPYINITQELQKFSNMSMELVEKSKPNTIDSMNHEVVDWDGQSEKITLDFTNVNDKYLYYTIDATKFGMDAPWATWQKVLEIKGITEDKFLFLTIDVGTNEDAYFNKSWLVYKSDDQESTYGTGEVTLEEGGTRVLYNIVGRDQVTNEIKPFDGKAVFGERRNGTILAPKADVNIAGNTNGTIIGKNVVCSGESHRCDVQIEGEEDEDVDWDLEVEEPKPEPTKPAAPEKKLEVEVEKKWSGGEVNQNIIIRLYQSYEPNLNVNTDTSKLTDTGKTITLSSGNWKATFKDLPAYDKNNGNKTIYYYVKEETPVQNYTASYDKNGISVDKGKVTITNTKNKMVTVTAKKVWNPDTIAPTTSQETKTYKIMPIGDSITFGEGDSYNNTGGYRKHLYNLLKDKYTIDMVGPEGSENDEYNDIKYDGNHAGYQGHQSDCNDKNYSLLAKLEAKNAINTAQPDIVLLLIGTNDVNAPKSHEDFESDFNKLLDHVVRNLPSDSVIFVGSIPAFRHTYGDHSSANVAGYNNIVENVVKSYVNSGKNVRFVDVNGWLTLNDLRDGIHPSDSGYETMGVEWAKVVEAYIKEIQPVTPVTPEETRDPITVKLYQSTNGNLDAANPSSFNGMTPIEIATLNADNGWTHKFNEHPAMENNQLLYYYVVEENPPTYYTPSYENNGVNSNNGTVVVTNTKEELLNITLDKEWVGDNSKDDTQVEVKLYWSTERNLDMTLSDAEFQSQYLDTNRIKLYADKEGDETHTKYLTANNPVEFKNLPVRDDQNKMIYYYVRESDVSGFKPSYSQNPVYGGDKVVTITNTKLINISVKKEWVINSTNIYTAQPVNVELYKYKHVPAEGEMSFTPTTFIPLEAKWIKTETIQFNNGTVTFTDLPIEEDGYKLFYYIREGNASEFPDFNVTYGNMNNANDDSWQLVNPGETATLNKFITNKEKAQTEISISVNKKWNATDYFYDADGDGKYEPPEDYYVQDSVNPVEEWADPIRVILQYSTDGTNWVDYYQNPSYVEFYDEYTFTGLPKTSNGLNNNDGTPYYYRVVEENTYGYVTTYYYSVGGNYIKANDIQKGQATPVVDLTNTLLKRTLKVKKNWYNNIDEGVDKVVVQVYRKTSPLQGDARPDLGINKGGTTSTPTEPETPTTTIQGMFENGSDDGWKLTGYHSNNELTSAVVSSTNWDAANDSGPGAYMVYINGLIEYTDQNVLSNYVAGKTYSFSAQVTRPYYAKLVVNFSDGTSTVIWGKDQYETDPGTAWADLSGEFVVPEGETVTSLQVGIDHADGLYGAPLCIDDVQVEEVESAQDYIFHHTFENSSNDGWTLSGFHTGNGKTSEILTSTEWDANAGKMEGTGAYAVYLLGLIDYTNQSVLSTLAGGNTYSLSAQVTRPYYTKFIVNYTDGSSEEITFTDKSTATAWTDVSAEFTVPSGKTVSSLQIGINHSDGGIYTALCVDNVILKQVSSNTEQPTEAPTQPPTEAPTEAPTQAPTNPPSGSGTIIFTFESTNGGWSGDNCAVEQVTGSGANQTSGYLQISPWSNYRVKYSATGLVSGGEYAFSAWVFQESGSTKTIELTASSQSDAVASVNVESGVWKNLSGNFTVPSGVTEVEIKVGSVETWWSGNNYMYVDEITLTGPGLTSATKAKPRTPETFFTNRTQQTKSTLSIQKMESNKLAKGYEANHSELVNVTLEKDKEYTFYRFTDNDLVGKTLSHVEVHLVEGGSYFPNDINIYLGGVRLGDRTGTGQSWPIFGSNTDQTIYYFGNSYEFVSNSNINIKTSIPENIEKIVVQCTDGSRMTFINSYNITIRQTTDEQVLANLDTALAGKTLTSVEFHQPDKGGYGVGGTLYLRDSTDNSDKFDNFFMSGDTKPPVWDSASGIATWYPMNEDVLPDSDLALTLKLYDNSWPGQVKKIVINYTDADGNAGKLEFNNHQPPNQKVYPLQVGETIGWSSTTINNVLLPEDELGEKFAGKKLDKLDVVFKDKLLSNMAVGDINEKALRIIFQQGVGKTEGNPTPYINGNNLTYDYDLTILSNHRLNVWVTDNAAYSTAVEDIEKFVLTFDDGTTYTINNHYYVRNNNLNKSHETSFTAANGSDLLHTSGTDYKGYSGKKLDHIIVDYGDEFVAIPRDLIEIEYRSGVNTDAAATDSSPTKITDADGSEHSMMHDYGDNIVNVDVLKIIEGMVKVGVDDNGNPTYGNDGFELKDIKDIKLVFDGGNSTYTIHNSDYSPKGEATPPAIGNQPVLDSSYVFITELELTRDGNWEADLSKLPVTDGQGQLYEYVIVEKAVYGEGADRYQLVSYEHPDGVYLDDDDNNDTIQTSFMNASKDDKNGPIIMPSAGGEGRTWFYVGGIALMLCGIAGCYGMKRWQKSRR